MTPTAIAAETAPVPELGMILRYVGLTAVSFLLLIFTTRAIGQAPLLRFGGNNTPLTGWQPITDSQLTFTLNLPVSWQAIELTTDPSAQTMPPLPTLADSFTGLVADSELLFLGLDEAETAVSHPFVLIAQSQRLTQLTAQQYIAYAQTQFPDTLEILDAAVTTNDLGQMKGQLHFNLLLNDNQWRCTHQFLPSNTTAFLLTTCADINQFTDQQTTFEAILLSFQPLES
ncbi:MAG: hypothetical protein KC445_20215 [Anaerolineales bacterium]|nr:hypothetical protein [Anaerolineales bacterium]